ncbi:MAG: phosphonate ABC transporter ATP-binding protein [Clostridiales Family XIII bacterium]|nr:phosphonate ABC transporter ATP-binding protein [Clostridiales Family XIII bacterium]
MNKILSVKNLTKRYRNGITALSNVSMEIEHGEFVAIIGSSGSGKSTLLRCINRLIQPTEGSVEFDGSDICKLSSAELKKIRRKIGMIFQHHNLVNSLTVIQNVLHGRLGYMRTIPAVLGLYSDSDRRKALDLLEQTGLNSFVTQRAGELSGGQQQRVGILRALMQNPMLMLCDEPIASLDPHSAKLVMGLIKQLTVERGITCIVNLHQVEAAVRYATRIIGLDHGNIVFDDTPDKLTDDIIRKIYGGNPHDLIIGGKMHEGTEAQELVS